MKKGDIVLVPFPFTNLTGQKIRPALVLVVSEDDIIIAFITTKSHGMTYEMSINPSYENGLKAQSFLRVNKLATVERELVLGRLGSLSSFELASLNSALKVMFQL